jgi:hypothetical protein
MKLAVAFLLCAGLAAAQTQAAPDPVAASLRRAEKLAPPRAVERLRQEAAGDRGSAEVFAALSDPDARAELSKRLSSADADGSLRAELEALAKAAPKPSRAREAAESITVQSLDGRPGGPVEEPEGFSGKTDVYAGSIGAGGRRAPTLEAHGTAGYKNGPWEGELEVSGLVAPYGGSVPGVYSLGVGVQRKLGDTSNFAFAEAEAERDELLGVSFSRSLRVGLGRDLIDSARQALTLAVGIGPNVEGKFDGTERFLSPSLGVDYTLHLTPVVSLVQKVEAEFNASTPSDIELSSVTSAVWKLSEKLSVQLTHSYKGRTEQVPGYAQSRSSDLIGLHYDF